MMDHEGLDHEFTKLIEKISKYDPNPDIELIKKAYMLSKQAHEGQVRYSGEPFLLMPLVSPISWPTWKWTLRPLPPEYFMIPSKTPTIPGRSWNRISEAKWPIWSTALPSFPSFISTQSKNDRSTISEKCFWLWPTTSASY